MCVCVCVCVCGVVTHWAVIWNDECYITRAAGTRAFTQISLNIHLVMYCSKYIQSSDMKP